MSDKPIKGSNPTHFWLKEVERLAPKTIIDLGCGTGLLTCELANRGYNMIGVEPAGKMFDIARKKLYADKVQWIEGGYEKFEGLKTDMVLMTSHVAQFFLDDKEWQAMLEAAHKALNSGGHIIFDSRTPIFPPYQTWPTEETPRRVQDATLGPIDWYYKLLGIGSFSVSSNRLFAFCSKADSFSLRSCFSFTNDAVRTFNDRFGPSRFQPQVVRSFETQ